MTWILIGLMAEPAMAEGEAEGGEEHEHRNEIAVFIGSTEGEVEDGEKEDRDFTLGVDYERRLSPLIGMGGLFDWVVEGRREYLIGIPVFFHPYKGAKFIVAPCAQREREADEFNYVTRLGLGWDFEVGRTVIAPEIFYDLSEGDDFVVFGVSFGWGF